MIKVLGDIRCEWDPEHNRPAEYISMGNNEKYWNGCVRPATLCIGNGSKTLKVCNHCAALPRFRQFKVKYKLYNG